jgi:hypothetical protein
MIDPTLIRTVVVLLGVAHLTMSTVFGQEDLADWRAQIKNAWQKRQGEAQTLQFEIHAEIRNRKIGTRDEFSEETRVYTLSFDGNKFGLRRRLIEQDGTPPLKGLYDPHSTSDGRTSQDYTGTTDLHTRGTGTIEDVPYPLVAGLVTVKPITLLYRPLITEVTEFDLRTCTLKDRDAMVDGTLCWVITDVLKAQPALSYGLWLDPARDFIPLRYQSWVYGDNSVRLDIDYRQDEELGWMPTSWEMTHLNLDGDLSTTNSCRVTKAAVNLEVPESEFRVAFPAGTFVTDKITGIEYVQDADSNLLAWLITAIVVAIVATFTVKCYHRFWKGGGKRAPASAR